MKTHTQETTTSTAFTKPLAPPLPYTYSWEEFENKEEFIAAKAEMTIAEQMKARNREAKANARNKAMNAALLLAGHEKPNLENDPQFRLKEQFKLLMSTKLYTEDKAREMASTMLQTAWEEDDE
jgi:hypothetical protein